MKRRVHDTYRKAKKYSPEQIKDMEYKRYVLGMGFEEIGKPYGVGGLAIARQLDENAGYFAGKRLRVPNVTKWNFFNDNIEGI